MIKVLEHGVKKVTCPNCRAKLQYELEDICEGITDESFLDVGKNINLLYVQIVKEK